jgi:membrane-associated phospholipid phosphatase
MIQDQKIHTIRRYVYIMLMVYVAWLAMYYFTAWIGSLRGPAFNAAIPLDSSIPYLPAFLPVYYLAYVTIAGIFLISREPAFLNRAYISIIAANAFAFVFFMAFPVLGPERITDTTGHSVVQNMVQLTHFLDSRYNAFPSLHVANPVLLFLLSARHRGLSWLTLLFLILALSISAATLLVKQHYLLDVVSGVVLAVSALAVVSRLKISGKHW